MNLFAMATFAMVVNGEFFVPHLALGVDNDSGHF